METIESGPSSVDELGLLDENNGSSVVGRSLSRVITVFIFILVIITFPISGFFCYLVVKEYERAIVFRLGRVLSGSTKGPGLCFILPCIDTYRRMDLRTSVYNVPMQEILTKDSVTLKVDAVVYYRVLDACAAVTRVRHYKQSTQLLAATTLRNILGTRTLSEILIEKKTIATTIQGVLDDATLTWGVKVERIDIKDVVLPTGLLRSMAAAAEASREAKAKVIAAEGEQKASRALREAAEMLSGSEAAIQLRYLQTLVTISTEKNHTIMFPVPSDLLKVIGQKMS